MSEIQKTQPKLLENINDENVTNLDNLNADRSEFVDPFITLELEEYEKELDIKYKYIKETNKDKIIEIINNFKIKASYENNSEE